MRDVDLGTVRQGIDTIRATILFGDNTPNNRAMSQPFYLPNASELYNVTVRECAIPGVGYIQQYCQVTVAGDYFYIETSWTGAKGLTCTVTIDITAK